MTYPEIRLVDAPTATANVLFDFNDTTASPRREVDADDFTIGIPEVVGDVDAVDPLYGERVVSFVCSLTGSKPLVAAAQSALARRLLAPGQSWLWVRVTPTSRLLFFRTYRPQPGDLSFDLIQSTSSTAAERWELKIDLPCEPFAYGERVVQSAVSIGNDPTTGTNQMRVTLPSIVGDAPSALRLESRVTPSSLSGHFMALLHATQTERAPLSVPIGTSDGLTVGTGTSAPVSDSAYTNGSYRQVTFTSPNLTNRLAGTVANVTPGRYRAVLRAAVTGGTSDTPAVQIRLYSSGPASDAITVPRTAATWIDLGVIDLPKRRPMLAADQGPTFPASFAIYAASSSGTPTLVLDHLLLIPVDLYDTVDSRTLLVDHATNLDPTLVTVWDGDEEFAWTKSAGTGSLQPIDIEVRGTFVRGIPGATNILHLFQTAGVVAIADQIGNSTSLTVSYYPRFLYVGDF